MSNTIEIQPRDITKKPNALRSQGLLPATMYGPEIDATSIQLNAKDFSKISFADYKRLIELKTNDEVHEVLIKKVQKDFVSKEPLNIEFYKVKKGHSLTTEVALNFIGSSEAVKLGASLATMYSTVQIRCLPKDIPYSVDVDITALKNVGDMIAFQDVKVDESTIEILNPPKEIICKAQAKRGATVLAAEEEAENATNEETSSVEAA